MYLDIIGYVNQKYIFVEIQKMLKITDKDYFLPTIEALNGIRLLGTGTTQPMLIRGICTKTYEKSDYVVKYCNAPRMSIESSARELIAAFIARELELNVVEPAIINVSNDFVDTLRGNEGFKSASNSVGINFGCKFVTGMMEFLKNQQLSEKQFGEAERIFALDVFISNADRRKDKQNMLTDGEKVLIFDHELAFGFVLDIIKNKTPWIISESDKTWIKNHYFYPSLKENDHNFDKFVDSFKVLDENFWVKSDVLMPSAWKSTQLDEIKSNLTSLVANKEIFLEQLCKVLS